MSVRHLARVFAAMILLSGCSSQTSPSSRGDLPRVTVLQTGLSVAEATDEIDLELRSLGFKNNPEDFFQPNQDFFFGHVRRVTANGQRVDVDCEWLSDSSTRVRLTTSLSQLHHDETARYVRERLATAATRPAEE